MTQVNDDFHQIQHLKSALKEKEEEMSKLRDYYTTAIQKIEEDYSEGSTKQ
jgi:hypothetical protein